MANTVIVIKRSQDTAAPPALANGELAYSFSSNKLFIGKTQTSTSNVSVEYIGGKILVDKVANLESVVLGDSAVLSGLTLSNAPENALLYSKADGVIDYLTGTSGKIMQIASNGTPVFSDLNGGTF